MDKYGGTTQIQSEATGSFRAEKISGRWWLITPEGQGFLSLGVNHIDSSFLKYPDNIHIWRGRYGSTEKWIKTGVVPDLNKWHFNTIGWTQELVAEGMGHSPGWRHSEYKCADMPYVHLLKFADFAVWDDRARYPEVFRSEFADWCDYIARESCVDMADDPNLIGYFFADVPGWKGNNRSEAYFPGVDAESEAGLRELRRIAEKYYRVISDSIRRYDAKHLLFGDRFDGDGGIPDCVIESAMPFVDIFSVQYYAPFSVMENDLRRWNAMTDRPILLADSAFLAPTRLLKVAENARVYCATQRDRGEMYVDFATAAFSTDYVIGWHWCAYAENLARKSGIKDHFDEPYEELVERMADMNNRTYEMVLGTEPDKGEKSAN